MKTKVPFVYFYYPARCHWKEVHEYDRAQFYGVVRSVVTLETEGPIVIFPNYQFAIEWAKKG